MEVVNINHTFRRSGRVSASCEASRDQDHSGNSDSGSLEKLHLLTLIYYNVSLLLITFDVSSYDSNSNDNDDDD